jgi:hypothetical protein
MAKRQAADEFVPAKRKAPAPAAAPKRAAALNDVGIVKAEAFGYASITFSLDDGTTIDAIASGGSSNEENHQRRDRLMAAFTQVFR